MIMSEQMMNVQVIDSPTGIIEKRAHSYNHNLVNIEIQDGIKEIGDAAFSSCSKLVSVRIPDSVERIGKNPFDGCTDLNMITVSPDHPYLAVIDGVLFSKKDRRLVCCPTKQSYRGGTKYKIPQGIRIVGAHAFTLTIFSQVVIPDSVEIIEEYAFFASRVTSMDIPESVKSIDGYAFKGTRIKSARLKEGLCEVGMHAFADCEKLAELSLPASLRKIGACAFSGCGKLKNISIPDTVTDLDVLAFDLECLDEPSRKRQEEVNKILEQM